MLATDLDIFQQFAACPGGTIPRTAYNWKALIGSDLKRTAANLLVLCVLSRRHKCQSLRTAARWQGKRFSGFHLLVDSIIHLLVDSIIHASRIFAHSQPSHGTLASVNSNAPIAVVLLLLHRYVLNFAFCPALATVLRLLRRWETQLPILIRAVPDSKFNSTWVLNYFDLWSFLFLLFTASWMLLVVLFDLINFA